MLPSRTITSVVLVIIVLPRSAAFSRGASGVATADRLRSTREAWDHCARTEGSLDAVRNHYGRLICGGARACLDSRPRPGGGGPSPDAVRRSGRARVRGRPLG